MRKLGSAGIVVCGVAAALIISSAETLAADKSSYSLFNPTPDSALRDMATDRPDKTESPYTVDAGLSSSRSPSTWGAEWASA